MNLNRLSAVDRGYMQTPVFEGRTLFSNGIPGTKRPDNFGAIYVFNDDILYPASHLGMHPHKNVEIITVMPAGTAQTTRAAPVRTGRVAYRTGN